MATTLNGLRWAENYRERLIGVRKALRQAAASTQTLLGQYNAMTSAQKIEMRDAFAAQGVVIQTLLDEVTALNTLATSIMSSVADTPDVI